MEFPLNQLKLDPSYISAIEDKAESRILAQYTAFKRVSGALVKAFKCEVVEYGSINAVPFYILVKYHTPLSSLFDIYKNLKDDLQWQVNRNTKDLVLIQTNGDEDSFINGIALRKREKLYGKIEYFDTILKLHVAIELIIERG